MTSQSLDVLVVGGGVTGAGIALDAATRGLSVALVERCDWAHGTSRWSSKLVHGGLRYLAHGDVAMAHESARERGVLMERTAPHLARALPFVLPSGGAVSRRSAALLGLGFVAGATLRATAGTRRSTLPNPRALSLAETVRWFPAVKRAGLRGGILSWDGQLTDDARLVVALVRTAAAHGALVANHCAAGSLEHGGAIVTDRLTGQAGRVRARHVVNATGVWAEGLVTNVGLRLSKGAHLVVDGARLGHPPAALTVPFPGSVSRFLLVLPQPDGRAYVGLTDHEVSPPVHDEPVVTPAERDALLEGVNRALDVPLQPDDVIGAYAGYRPLLALPDRADKDTADLSRRHAIIEGDGVITITGGKLTTYRRMAADVVDRISGRPCVTASTPLVGALPQGRLGAVAAPPWLISRYGAEAPDVLAAGPSGRILEHLPYLRGELVFAVQREQAASPADLLDRRTRIGLVPADRAAALDAAREALATML